MTKNTQKKKERTVGKGSRLRLKGGRSSSSTPGSKKTVKSSSGSSQPVLRPDGTVRYSVKLKPFNGREVYREDLQVPDERIDLSDMPQLSREQLAKFQPVSWPPVPPSKRRGRPLLGASKQMSRHLRLDPRGDAWLRARARKLGKPIQRVLNELLIGMANSGQ